ncbi:glyoxalase [Sphingorhabdus sp. IMCC26285]|jgi:catechol 2,3-dioxygenase-like lactoylglutathione lyase family enzyme|uniref:Glyoxalase n=1 Tax=Sphingorhabdus profundilacus TaxID=2509718 RepID=A0A6I4M265_9SPHN|nr:VOC family protein [Sphingorhabdus profundilacus]MVZ96415.1 glyoxalase [Sphingorhabdus profundilacus]
MIDFEIDHVQIAIPEGGEAQGRVFFGTLLGLAEIPKPPGNRKRGGCWFAAGSLQLHLGVDPEFRAAQKAHIAFKTNALDEARSLLEHAGYDIVSDIDVEGRRRFFTNDPFGNRIEFMDRTTRL